MARDTRETERERTCRLSLVKSTDGRRGTPEREREGRREGTV